MGNSNSRTHTDHTCPDKSLADPTQIPIVGNLSFHHLSVIISGACMAIACLLCFFLIFSHATHYSMPKEQRQVIRIIFTIPVFAIISFLGVAFNDASIYLEPIDDCYEAVALACFFLLLCQYVRETPEEREEYFNTTGTRAKYTAATVGTFQFPVVMLLVLVLTEITQGAGIYCRTSSKPYFAHIWLTLITVASTGYAVISILHFYKVTKATTKPRHPLSKFICFKLIVFLNFIQNTLFSFLTSSGDLKPTSHLTFKDLSIGIPNLIVSLEMVGFALAFSWVYRATDYKYHPGQENGVVPLGHGGYHGGFLGIKAYGQAMNILDLFGSMGEAIRGFMASRQGRGNDSRDYQGGNGNGYRLDGYEADGFAGEGAPVAGKDWGRQDVQQQQLQEPRRGLRHGRRHRGEY